MSDLSEFLFSMLLAVCAIELVCVLVMGICIRQLVRQLEIEREQRVEFTLTNNLWRDPDAINNVNKMRIANGLPPLTGPYARPEPAEPSREPHA